MMGGFWDKMVDGRVLLHTLCPGWWRYLPEDRFSDGGAGARKTLAIVSTGNGVHAIQKVLFNRVFSRNLHFNPDSDLQNSGLLMAGFLGSCWWSYEGEICQPVQSVSVSQIYDGEILIWRMYRRWLVRWRRSWGLRQASAPAAWASPHCDDEVLPVLGASLNAGNTHGIVCAPVAFWKPCSHRGERRKGIWKI